MSFSEVISEELPGKNAIVIVFNQLIDIKAMEANMDLV